LIQVFRSFKIKNEVLLYVQQRVILQ
jgi:hypothetical protein